LRQARVADEDALRAAWKGQRLSLGQRSEHG
jgi:hypothetical protein